MTDLRTGRLVIALYAVAAGLAVWEVATSVPGRTTARWARPAEELIAVVELRGPISLAEGNFGAVDAERVLRELRGLQDRADVKAVLLRINSPGGSVAAVQEIHQEVLALRKAGKKIVASFGDVAASGGYYIAAAADKIVADPGSITGSIGVIFQLGNVEELFRKYGVAVEAIKSGPMKDAGSPFRRLTAAERRHFQSLVADAYEQFFRAVAAGRGLPDRELRPLADGRVFTGAQAKEVRLVDVLGNFDTAVQTARELAGIRAKKPMLLYTTTPWDRVVRWLGSVSAARRLPFESSVNPRVRFEYIWE